jgi:hypothetical protein
MLRNFSAKVVKIPANTVIAKVLAANVIPRMLVPDVEGNEEDSEEESSTRNEEKTSLEGEQVPTHENEREGTWLLD